MAAARTEGLPWAYRFAALLVRPWLMLLTKRDWRGAEHLPREGGFVVSPNHISYADPLPFAHYMFDNGRGAYFLAKESVFRVRGEPVGPRQPLGAGGSHVVWSSSSAGRVGVRGVRTVEWAVTHVHPVHRTRWCRAA